MQEKLKIYVQPNPLNRRMPFHDSINTFDHMRHSTQMSIEWFVEGVQTRWQRYRRWTDAALV